MNGININGEFIDLFPSTIVELALKNPLFAEGNIIPGSYSLPFAVPIGDNSGKNSRLLQNPQVIENAIIKTQFTNSQLLFDGVLVKRGTIKVSGVDDRKCDLNFVFGLPTVSEEFKTKKLKEVCNDQVVISNTVYTKKIDIICRTAIFAGPFSIIVNGKTYTGNNNTEIAAAINADVSEPRASATYVNAPHPIYNPDAADYLTIQPFTNPNDINSPITVSHVEPSNPDHYQRIIITASEFEQQYNNPVIEWLNDNFYLENPLDERMYFPMIRNTGLYEEKIKYRFNIYDFNFVNAVYSDSGYVLNRPIDVDFGGNTRSFPFNRTSIAPFIRVKWVIEKMADFFGVGIEGDFISDPDLAKAFFYHSNTLDIRIPFTGATDWIACRRSFNISEFIPDWTFVDLLKNLQSRFNLAVTFNDKTSRLRIQKRDPIVKTNIYKDISSISSPTIKSDPIGSSVLLEASRDEEDQISVEDIYLYGENDSVDIPIKTSISRMPSQDEFRVSGGTGITEEGGNVYDLPLSVRRLSTAIPKCVFGFYAWKVAGSVDFPSANINLSGGDFRFSGEDGMAENWWKFYLRFLKRRRRVSIKCDFQLGDLINIDWELKRRFDRVNYLIESIDVKLTPQGIPQSNVTLLSVQ
jgi:hypothetical protein